MSNKIYTKEIGEMLSKRVSEMNIADLVEKAKKTEDMGRFKVVISTEDTDRMGEIVRQDGWDFSNYKNNPVVLWGHDYYSLPIGVCENIYVEGTKTIAEGFFLPADINPLAQQVRKMYELGLKKGRGVGCTTSVGFIVKEFDKSNMDVITKAELLEFSFVPVPANQGVGPAKGVRVTFEMAKELGLDTGLLVSKGIEFSVKEESEIGDACEMDDGSPGILGTDPNDSDGPLVCIPEDEDKAKKFLADRKGAVAQALTDEQKFEQKWQNVNKAWDIFDAFLSCYFDEKTDVEAFGQLLGETVELLKALAEKSAQPDNEVAKAMIASKGVHQFAFKAGAEISAANKDKLEKCYDAMQKGMELHKKASDIVKALHGGLGNVEGDEPADGEKNADGSPKEKVEARVVVVPGEVETHLFVKEIMRGIATTVQDALKDLNKIKVASGKDRA